MKIIFILFFLPLYIPINAQDSIIYNADFPLNEGIYKNVNEFRTNNPSIRKDSIITDIHSYIINYKDFYKENLEIDDSIDDNSYSNDSIWGYSENGIVYIYFKRKFNRLRLIGTIGHFVVSKNVYRNNTLFNSNVYSQGRIYEPKTNYKNIPYILDTYTGKVYKYNLNNFSLILKRDSLIYTEFNSFSARKKEKQMFIYLSKYNARNPLYFKNSENK